MNTQHHKEVLMQERDRILQELVTIGHINPGNELDWQPSRTDIDREKSDPIDTADNLEEYNENSAIINELEVRFNNINAALSRIDTNNFGVCNECNQPIEEDRLGANPAATTCKTHMS